MIKQVTLNLSKMFEHTELCPNCMQENDVMHDGEQTLKWECEHCGERLMLCGLCELHENGCDYDHKSDTCRHNKRGGE